MTSAWAQTASLIGKEVAVLVHLQDGREFEISTPDLMCSGCHNTPFVGAGGDRVSEVFVLGQRFDFLDFDHTDTIPTLPPKMNLAADATVSVLVIAGSSHGRSAGCGWTRLAGIIGACATATWSHGLIRDTGAALLDMNPDRRMAENVRQMIEAEGDKLGDLHIWRLGPGHLGAIVSVSSQEMRRPDYYRAKLARFRLLSHLTIQVEQSNIRSA